MMCLFTISVAPVFAYVRIKTKSILGPCMLHGMVNATGAIYILYIANWNELYSWIAGWAGIISATVLTICIAVLDKKFVTEYSSAELAKNQLTLIRTTEARTANKVLPKAGVTQYYWADRGNSTFVILLNGSAENPRLRQYPNR